MTRSVADKPAKKLPSWQNNPMLEALIVVLAVLWLLGAFVIHVGDFVHLLLVLILVIVAWRIIQGRPPA